MKQSFKSFIGLFSGHFAFFTSIASVLGVILLFVSDKRSNIIALIFFCVMLFVFTSHLIYFLFKILRLYHNNSSHENRSTFIKYETENGKIISYETYKLLQCKCPILTELDYNFRWSGSIMPKISSELQDVVNVIDLNSPNNYDKAILKFRKPLHYNQNTVLHFKADLDDTDGVSRPYVETRVINETDIIHYRIILKHKPENYDANAILERCKMNSTTSYTFTKIREIPFDKKTKTYEYHLLNPEIQYFYRIRWER